MSRLSYLLLPVVALAALAPASAQAPLPWPAPASPPLPPDLTVPYLPAVEPVICENGAIGCFHELEAILLERTIALGCDHDAIMSDSYLIVTRNLIDDTRTSGFFERPDRITHEARSYAQEYLDQFDRWHAGEADVSPSWDIAFSAAEDESVTSLGDLLLQLNAHIRRDNPIRAVEQTAGVLRVQGPMPEASGRGDHDGISENLADTLEPMMTRLAERYDPTIDDGVELWGMVMDPEGLYALISTWREESWRNAEQLRHARAVGGVNGSLYRSKLAQIEESARLGALAILAATRTTPEQNRARNAHCESHLSAPY